jgi:hypothetical protein
VRARIPGSWFALVMTVSTLAGCERVSGGAVSTFIPTAPSVPTAQPLVWDSREELSAWVNNTITKGTVSVEGAGNDAFIRAILGAQSLLLRGPDLEPPIAGIRAVSLRYRWTSDVQPVPGIEGTGYLGLFAYLQPANMTASTWQPMTSVGAMPTSGAWRESTLRFPDTPPAPTSVPMRYLRIGTDRDDVVRTYSSVPGTLDIDRIQLIR